MHRGPNRDSGNASMPRSKTLAGDSTNLGRPSKKPTTATALPPVVVHTVAHKVTPVLALAADHSTARVWGNISSVARSGANCHVRSAYGGAVTEP
jgi:hypothetical protein